MFCIIDWPIEIPYLWHKEANGREVIKYLSFTWRWLKALLSTYKKWHGWWMGCSDQKVSGKFLERTRGIKLVKKVHAITIWWRVDESCKEEGAWKINGKYDEERWVQ